MEVVGKKEGNQNLAVKERVKRVLQVDIVLKGTGDSCFPTCCLAIIPYTTSSSTLSDLLLCYITPSFSKQAGKSTSSKVSLLRNGSDKLCKTALFHYIGFCLVLGTLGTS